MGTKGSYARRKLTVAAVNVNNGNYEIFDESTPPQYYPLIVVASASVPFAFPPTTYNGKVLMDGGTAWNTNMISAIEKCS